MSRSDLAERAAGLPRLLVRIILAVADDSDHRPDTDRVGEADALISFGQLASRIVLTRGVVAPLDDDILQAIDSIARTHLESDRARDAFRKALNLIQPFADRDEVASAHGAVVSRSDLTYYYAGLSVGITLADLSR